MLLLIHILYHMGTETGILSWDEDTDLTMVSVSLYPLPAPQCEKNTIQTPPYPQHELRTGSLRALGSLSRVHTSHWFRTPHVCGKS